MENAEKWLLGGSLLLAIILTEGILFGGLGLGVVAGVVTYFICFVVFSRLYKRSISQLAKWLIVPISLCTLCFVIFGGTVLRGFNLIFLAVLILVHALEVFGKCENDAFLPGWMGEVLSYGIKLPFIHINKPVALMKAELGTGQKKNIKVIGKVLLGVVVAAPMLLVIVGLLASADAAFEGMIDFVYESINFSIEGSGYKVFFIIVLFFMVFSYFYGLSHKEEIKDVKTWSKPQGAMDYFLMEENEAQEDEKNAEHEEEEQISVAIEERNTRGFYLDFVVVSTAATMLCFVYLTFCFSQLAYFLSAFKGILPVDFTFAEYARRGFFETLPLAGFNLVVILLLSCVARRECGKKSGYIKAMISFITAFTGFMIISAISKMVMYMGEYGLSLWRVYVAWFLVLSLVIILLVFANVLIKRLQLIKLGFIVFTVMYLGLNYSNVDYFVALQNVRLYEQGKTSDISGCYNLSSSALGPIMELVKAHPEVLTYEGYSYYESTNHILSRLEYNLENGSWQAFNLADYRGRNELEVIKEAGYKGDGSGRRLLGIYR